MRYYGPAVPRARARAAQWLTHDDAPAGERALTPSAWCRALVLAVRLLPVHLVVACGVASPRPPRTAWEHVGHDPSTQVPPQAGSVVEAREMLAGVRCDSVALIDLQLPDGDGVEVIRAIGVTHPQAQILALTAVIDPVHHGRATDAGAAAIISKGAQPTEIVASIRQADAG
jgi:CheY-like chemotaxis protein